MAQLSELIPPGAETGAGLALQHRGRYLFMLAGMRHYQGGGSTFCAGIGGHCERGTPTLPPHYRDKVGNPRERGETWLECAQREAREELGAQVRIDSAAATAYIGRDGSVRPVVVDEEPRPLAIYELWNPPDAPWNKRAQGHVYYIVIYVATLDDAAEPEPGDLDAILWLTPAQLVAIAQVPASLRSLLEGGAELRTRAPLPDDWLVRPQGTAQALATLWQRGNR